MLYFLFLLGTSYMECSFYLLPLQPIICPLLGLGPRPMLRRLSPSSTMLAQCELEDVLAYVGLINPFPLSTLTRKEKGS